MTGDYSPHVENDPRDFSPALLSRPGEAATSASPARRVSAARCGSCYPYPPGSVATEKVAFVGCHSYRKPEFSFIPLLYATTRICGPSERARVRANRAWSISMENPGFKQRRSKNSREKCRTLYYCNNLLRSSVFDAQDTGNSNILCAKYLLLRSPLLPAAFSWLPLLRRKCLGQQRHRHFGSSAALRKKQTQRLMESPGNNGRQGKRSAWSPTGVSAGTVGPKFSCATCCFKPTSTIVLYLIEHFC